MRGTLTKAAEVSRSHLGRILLLGLALFIACPFVAVFFIALLVTAPIGVLMLAMMALLWAFSIPFAGFALGKAVFSKIGAKRAGIIGVLVLTVLCYVPGLFVVIPSLCALYTAGFALDCFIEKRRTRRMDQGKQENVPCDCA